MSDVLRIALVCPHPFPPRDDVADHVAAEAAALAARGHRVTVLAPGAGRERVAAGRARLVAADSGDAQALVAAPGQVLVVATGRALPTGPGRRLGEPFDLAGAFATALSRTPFDVVHLHEPLAPSPALAALRHAPAVTATTFHRAEPLVGVAFLRPLVDRALARADLRIATTANGRRTLSEMLPGDYEVIRPGIDPDLMVAPPPSPGPPGLVLVARGRDRVAARFALSVLRALDLERVGPVTLIGPSDAPWRTRAAVPKALRDAVRVVPDPGPAGRVAALADGAIALLAAPDEADGPVLREALAMGRVVLAPRCPATDEALAHEVDALVLPPFSREAWSACVAGLAGDPRRRGRLAAAAAAAGRARTWATEAAELEAAYRAAIGAGRGAGRGGRVRADLRVRPGRELTPARLVAACAERGIDAVAVAGPGGVAAARAVAELAPPGLTVIPGQEIATDDGVLVGLFLTRDVATGMSPEATATAIREQGGLVLLPHPASAPVPPPDVIRRLAGEIDCHEILSAGAGGGRALDEALLRRIGLRVCAGSGAERPEAVGSVATELRAFEGPSDLLDALGDAHLWHGRRPAGSREPRARGRRNRSRES